MGQLINDTPKEGYIACAQALKGLDYKKSLSQVSVPTCYIVGDKDGPHPAEMQILSELTPNAELIVLENAAHLSNLEQADAFNRAVLNFLAS